MKNKYVLLFAIAITLIISLPSYSGGPLTVRKGKAITYKKKPFVYRYDLGNLGMFSNQEAVDLSESLFSIYEDIPTSTIVLKQDSPGFLKEDLTADNIGNIIQPKTIMDLVGYTPIIFDDDGSILDLFAGSGASNQILGFAGPVLTILNNGKVKIDESRVVLNGKAVNGVIGIPGDNIDVDENTFKTTVLHEVGHAIGLDHSQINDEALLSPDPGVRETVPLMFPVALSSKFDLRRDDISSVSLLYPNESELAKFGQIKGFVFQADGKTPVLGANIIARNVNDPENEAISCVSDFLTRKTGEFNLFAVPPGDYKIEIEPINTRFVGGSGNAGSGVGPYATSLSDESFASFVPEGFFTGFNLPVTSEEDKALIVMVMAGEVVEDILVIANTSSEIIDFTLDGPGELELRKKKNKLVINFSLGIMSGEVNCKTMHNLNHKIKIKPESFDLNNDKNKQSIKVKLPKSLVKEVLSNGNSQTLSLKINCANGTEAIKEVLLKKPF